MKRIAISITIIALILVAGYSAVALIDSGNDRLYGKLELVTDSYRSQSPDVEARLRPMYRSDSDEFLAECAQIKEYARMILESEKVTWSKIL